jgi:AraC-like DNA-binding protein
MHFKLRSFRPCRALNPYIHCYVNMSENQEPWNQLLIPISIQNLGFIFDGNMTSSLDKNNMVSRSFVVGQQEHPQLASFGKDLDIITVIFKPSGMHRLFGIPMNLFTDRAIDFELVCSTHDKYKVQQILESRTILQRIATIESYLLDRLSHKISYQTNQIEYASRIIFERNGNIPIKRLAEDLNMSKRSLERRFTEHVGIAPKSFSGISRIRKILEMIAHKSIITWKEISNYFEFTDHAHFIHEFKKFTGKTPVEYHKSASEFEHFVYTT